MILIWVVCGEVALQTTYLYLIIPSSDDTWAWERLIVATPEMAERFTGWDQLGGFSWARILSRLVGACLSLRLVEAEAACLASPSDVPAAIRRQVRLHVRG